MDEPIHSAHSPKTTSPKQDSASPTNPSSPTTTTSLSENDEEAQQQASINRRFKVMLKEHYRRGLMARPSCKMLFNMSMMLSVMRVGLYNVFKLKGQEHDAIDTIEYWAGYVLQGCHAFQSHLDGRVADVEKEIAQLPMLDGVPRKTRQDNIKLWQSSLEKMHEPTGETARLFQLLAEYYEIRVYGVFQSFLWIRPAHSVWRLHDLFTLIQHQLDKLVATCETADTLVQNLETQLENALEELQRKEINRMTPIVEHEVAFLMPGNQPLREQRFMTSGDCERRPVYNKSFSAVEEKVHRRGHFRQSTISESAYTVDNGASYGDHVQMQPRSHQWQATISSRRQKSEIPRIFLGTPTEVQFALPIKNYHNIGTPESEAITTGSGIIGPIITRDFAHTPVTPSTCPSPATLLQLGEGLTGTQSPFRNKAKLDVRKGPEGMRDDDTQAIDNAVDDLSNWLHQVREPQIRQSTSDEPSLNINRSISRHRENTI